MRHNETHMGHNLLYYVVYSIMYFIIVCYLLQGINEVLHILSCTLLYTICAPASTVSGLSLGVYPFLEGKWGPTVPTVGALVLGGSCALMGVSPVCVSVCPQCVSVFPCLVCVLVCVRLCVTLGTHWGHTLSMSSVCPCVCPCMCPSMCPCVSVCVRVCVVVCVLVCVRVRVRV